METVAGYYPMFEELVDDHQYIRRSLKRIEKLILMSPSEDKDRKRRNHLLLVAIHTLHKKIKLHFEMEELHGIFEDLIEMNPDIEDEVHALFREHGSMLWKLSKVDELALSLDSGQLDDYDPLKRHFTEFVDSLKEHEATEHLLISEVYPVSMHPKASASGKIHKTSKTSMPSH